MATYVLVMLHGLPTRMFSVLPNSGHVINKRALAQFVFGQVTTEKRQRIVLKKNWLNKTKHYLSLAKSFKNRENINRKPEAENGRFSAKTGGLQSLL